MVQASIRSASAEDGKAVRDAAMQWYVALNAMLKGDPEPFAALYSHADDVTYMGAEGGMRVGWDATYADWKAQAAKRTPAPTHACSVPTSTASPATHPPAPGCSSSPTSSAHGASAGTTRPAPA